MRRRSGYRWSAACSAAALCIAAFVPGLADGRSPEKLAPILAEMAARGTQFRADKLHAMGLDGLTAVLDWFLPDTAGPKTVEVPDARVAGLIAQMGDESSRVREAATQQLFRLGAAAQAAMVEAARSTDAEISWRAVRILRAWEAERNQDVNRYTTGLNVYLSGVADEPRLKELARRSKLVLDAGLPANAGRRQVVYFCILALSRAGKDEHLEGLRPFVKQGDAQVATVVLQAVAAGRSPDNPCPAILLDALESKEQQVVSLALNFATAGSDAPRADQLKDRLHAILKGNDENMKLQACRPLVCQFGDAEALDYVHTLLNGPPQDLGRKHQALAMLSDARLRGKPINPKVLEMLLALIKSNETNLRLPAVNALANYGGEDVVRALIPLLGDPLSSVSSAASRGLQMQPDRKMVRDRLAAAAKDNENEKVKQRAAALVKQLDATPAAAPAAGTRGSRLIRRAPDMIQEDADDLFGP